MPALARITVSSGSACLYRWGQSASRSCAAACQTQRVLQKQPPSIPAINSRFFLKTTTGVASKLGSGLFVPLSRRCSMSASMSQRMVWVDLEVRHCFKGSLIVSLIACVNSRFRESRNPCNILNQLSYKRRSETCVFRYLRNSKLFLIN